MIVFEYLKGKTPLIIDLSFLMYRSFYAYRNMSYVSKSGVSLPSGHVFGTVLTCSHLKDLNYPVIAVVDSHSDRISSYSEYKGTRKHDYEIRNELAVILGFLSKMGIPYLKVFGHESDDIISSFVWQKLNPFIFAEDNDLFTVPLPFQVVEFYNGNSTRFTAKDMIGYIKNKYGFDLFFIPLWWFVIRGKKSNNLKPGLPRFKTKELIKLCEDLRYSIKFEELIDYLEKRQKVYDYISLKRNYDLVVPKFVNVLDLNLKIVEDDQRLEEYIKESGLEVLRSWIK